MSRLLDEKTVRLLKDPSRGWVITTLQELYKMTKARKFANRYAFYDAITLKVVASDSKDLKFANRYAFYDGR
jgi:hypothetical protein